MSAEEIFEAPCEPARWPYVVGLASLLVGVAGFLYAPISGIAYVALPGALLGAIWAWSCRAPARFAALLAAAVLAAGIVSGVLALTAFADGGFAQQEWFVIAALLVCPFLGAALGIPAMIAALTKPGTRPSWLGPSAEAVEADPENG